MTIDEKITQVTEETRILDEEMWNFQRELNRSTACGNTERMAKELKDLFIETNLIFDVLKGRQIRQRIVNRLQQENDTEHDDWLSVKADVEQMVKQALMGDTDYRRRLFLRK